MAKCYLCTRETDHWTGLCFACGSCPTGPQIEVVSETPKVVRSSVNEKACKTCGGKNYSVFLNCADCRYTERMRKRK